MSTQSAASANGSVLAEFDTYDEAVALVDQLSDAKFPVERVRIIGTGLESVEQVTGRMTVGRATLYGALSGLWFGLFLGLLFVIVLPGGVFWTPILWAAGLGIVWGAIFGAIGQGITGGSRDFSSVKAFTATRYGVHVDEGFADQAFAVIRGASTGATSGAKPVEPSAQPPKVEL